MATIALMGFNCRKRTQRATNLTANLFEKSQMVKRRPSAVD